MLLTIVLVRRTLPDDLADGTLPGDWLICLTGIGVFAVHLANSFAQRLQLRLTPQRVLPMLPCLGVPASDVFIQAGYIVKGVLALLD
jgi:hypothetical protein